MTKKLIKVEMERDSLQQKWGITIQVKVDVFLDELIDLFNDCCGTMPITTSCIYKNNLLFNQPSNTYKI